MADAPNTGGADATGGSDEAPAPLTTKELELVKRLFSDPFAIPLEFKAWLVAYLETNPPLLTAASIFGFRSTVQQQILASATGIPIAQITQYYGSTDPPDQPDWLLMDNRLLTIAAYPLLYGRIGFSGSYPTPGVDPGGGQFYLPEGRGAVLVGKGTHADVNAIGKNDGNIVSARRILHKHVVAAIQRFSGAGNSLDGVPGYNPASTNLASTTPGITVGPQTGSEPTDGPAYLVCNHIIYAPG